MSPELRRRIKNFAVWALFLGISGAWMVHRASARVVGNTIDPVAALTDNGRGILVTGPISCTESESGELRVVVTQRETGAVAEGRARITCTPTIQQWEVRAQTQGNETFQEGPATAVALVRTMVGGRAVDAHQWLVDITIVRR